MATDATTRATPTPGPWKADATGLVITDWQSDQVDEVVARPCEVLKGDYAANARLIAAAPDLLRVAKDLYEQLFKIAETCHLRTDIAPMEEARLVIEKAEGR